MKTKKQLLQEISDLNKKVDELLRCESENIRIIEILKESEREKKAILDTMFECVVLVDDNLSILWTNKEVTRYFTMTADELKGKYCYELFAGRNKPCRDCNALNALSSGKMIARYDISFLGRRWMSRYYPLINEKKILAVYTDITESKAMKEALYKEQAHKDLILAQLIKSEQKYKKLFEDSKDAIFVMNIKGKIIEANQAYLNLFGLTKQELVNLDIWKYVFINEARKEFVNKIHKEKNIVDYLVHVRKGRAVIDCLVTISLKYGEDGNIWGYQGIIRDITERKKLEKEVLETSERERFEIGLELHDSLGQLLTGIALKSKSIAQDLEKVLPTKAKDVQKLVNLSNEAIRKTKQIVSGLVPANFGKEGLLRSLEALAIETRNNYGIFCDISSNSCHVELDDTTITQLYRITQEAIINAVKHGNANRVIIALNKANGEIVLSIKDDGVGFAVNNKMFEGRGRRIMAYRARMVDAMLNICKNEDDKGVNIICTLRDKKIN